MNTYNSVYDTANYSSTFDQVDEKRCYESRDSYFDCLDLKNDMTDNKYKCYDDYKSWSVHCPGSYRKAQSFERQMEKDNNYLYNAERLK